MDGVPYEKPWGVEAEALAGSTGGAGRDPSAGEMTSIAVVILVEIVVIAGLLFYLWRRKRSQAIPLREGFLPGPIQGPGVQRIYRGVIFVTIGMFAGYASLTLLQHNLMVKMEDNISDWNKQNPDARLQQLDKTQFKHAATFNYIGNLVFRLAHNVVFACTVPRYRVYISLLCMMGSMGMIGVGIYGFGGTSIAWVFGAYTLGGIGIGTFESNLLASISTLGHDTKLWAIAGMPVGFVTISVFGFLARSAPPLGAGVDTMYLYYFVILATGNGIVWWFAYIPQDAHALSNTSNTNNLRTFRESVNAMGEWLPLIKWNCLALMVNMYAVSFFTAIPFYVYNDSHCIDGSAAKAAGTCQMISMIQGKGSTTLMNHDRFFAVFNMHTFLGDTISRKVAYYFEPRNPMVYLFFTIVGAVMASARIPILLWPGLFAIFFANGAIYATTTRFIDQQVHKDFNLISLSFWLFIGDVGSVDVLRKLLFLLRRCARRTWVATYVPCFTAFLDLVLIRWYRAASRTRSH